MTRPSSTCSSGVVQAAAAGSRTWEGNKKKKNVHFSPALTSLLSLQFQGTPADTTLHWLAPSEGCLHVHRANAPAPFTQPSEGKKKTFGIEIAAKGRTQRQLIVSCSPFWCNISFFMFLQSISMSASPHGGRKEKKGTVTLLWISYIPRNTFSSDGVLKPESTESLREAKTKEALSSLSGRSHSHGYATFKCACASIHAHTQYSACSDAGLSRTDTLAFASVRTQTPWCTHTHTHTSYSLCVCQPHVRKMKESWQSAASSLSTAANLLCYATPGSPPNCRSFFSTLFIFYFFC